MDSEIKKELIATGVSSILMPLVRVGADHHFTMKQMEKRREMAVEVAEKRQDSIRAMAQAAGGGARHAHVPTPESPGDVYDELQAIHDTTDCGFCRQTAGMLLEAPPEEAAAGYQELSTYIAEAERIEGRDVSQAEAERIVSDVIDGWETIPRYMAQTA